MAKSKPKTIEEILRKFDPEQVAIAERLRTIVKSAVPDAAETVRRGIITYIVDDKDFANIHLFKDHVDIGLMDGAKIDSKQLKGTGQGRDLKHVKIVSLKKLNETELSDLLKNAATLT
jgi:hypothetical protein